MTRRWRRRWKWAGVIVACAIALVWFDSRWHGAVSCIGGSNNRVVLLIGRGAVMIGAAPPWIRPRLFEYLPAGIADAEPAWSWGFHVDSGSEWNVAVPLWCPFLLVASATAWLWYRDLRQPKGCCPRCGYDLSGIASGICPECGPPSKGPAGSSRA